MPRKREAVFDPELNPLAQRTGAGQTKQCPLSSQAPACHLLAPWGRQAGIMAGLGHTHRCLHVASRRSFVGSLPSSHLLTTSRALSTTGSPYSCYRQSPGWCEVPSTLPVPARNRGSSPFRQSSPQLLPKQKEGWALQTCSSAVQKRMGKGACTAYYPDPISG